MKSPWERAVEKASALCPPSTEDEDDRTLLQAWQAHEWTIGCALGLLGVPDFVMQDYSGNHAGRHFWQGYEAGVKGATHGNP